MAMSANSRMTPNTSHGLYSIPSASGAVELVDVIGVSVGEYDCSVVVVEWTETGLVRSSDVDDEKVVEELLGNSAM